MDQATLGPIQQPASGDLALSEAVKEIRAAHQRMNPKEGKDTLQYLREGREGEMYGLNCDGVGSDS